MLNYKIFTNENLTKILIFFFILLFTVCKKVKQQYEIFYKDFAFESDLKKKFRGKL